jgi:hypothetical protein
VPPTSTITACSLGSHTSAALLHTLKIQNDAAKAGDPRLHIHNQESLYVRTFSKSSYIQSRKPICMNIFKVMPSSEVKDMEGMKKIYNVI